MLASGVAAEPPGHARGCGATPAGRGPAAAPWLGPPRRARDPLPPVLPHAAAGATDAAAPGRRAGVAFAAAIGFFFVAYDGLQHARHRDAADARGPVALAAQTAVQPR